MDAGELRRGAYIEPVAIQQRRRLIAVVAATLALVSCERDDRVLEEEGCTFEDYTVAGSFFLRSDLLTVDTLIVGCEADTLLRDRFRDSYREVGGQYEYIMTYELGNAGPFGARWTFETFYTGPADSLVLWGSQPYYRDFTGGRNEVDGDFGLNVTCTLPDGRTFTTRPADPKKIMQTTARSSTSSQQYFSIRSDGEPRLPNEIGFSLHDELYEYRDSAGVSVPVDSAYVQLDAVGFDLRHLH